MTNKIKQLSEAIGDMVRGVNSITSQAQELAAARADEHGRGFGVVADEVRKLAVNSASATENIENSLNNMKELIETILVQMQNINNLTQNQAALTQELNAAIDEINDMSNSLMQIFSHNLTLFFAFK